ncbi:hypothetical protein FA10DRAFT_160301 [Acaromyces ingoldii]|uniref:Zn(2)-C6 fungal-type domain-containing protein n=1 Tax=Acaromyces ingoldii TaxID=215250 RepID=A0A316YGN0_9BASI|nr:hypothetical protein FA10DRAFT_160301 [Acaromyces ingoldii]PWN88322.1 hypothetical protein FA10DRAFT_160301 [Acaromyces ingoldii]
MTPPADPSPPAAKRRKKRLPISCLECRTRKERCDRNVPGCANCRKRNVDCRWGDERDENVASSSSYGSPAATTTPRSVARKAQTEASPTVSAVVASAANTNSSNAIEGSLQGIESYASGGRFDLSLSSLSASEQASRRRKLALNIASRLPSKELTHELAERHLDLSHHAFYCIDMQDFFLAVDELWPALEALRGPAPSSSSTERFRPIRFDVLACLLMVLAASAQEMPRTYLIGLGLVSTSEQVSSTISTWLEDGLDCIDLCQRQAELTMTALQAICVFELWLADRVPVYRQTSLLDLAARSAARLGLDRLSNDERDRLAWKQPSFGRPQSSQSGPLSWGAARFFAKDAHSREIGRAVWYIVSMLLSVTVTFYYWNPRSAVDSMPPGQLISLQDEAAYNVRE